MTDFDRESMLEMFTFEMSQLLEQLEQNIIQGESGYTVDMINEIFRIMHTIKGSAAMMMFTSVATAAHAIEDLFYYLREEHPTDVDFSKLTDLILESLDFIKAEITKIENGLEADGDCKESVEEIGSFLQQIKGDKVKDSEKEKSIKETSEGKSVTKHKRIKNTEIMESRKGLNAYFANVRFDDKCEMENVRALILAKNLKDIAISIEHEPKDIVDESSIDDIRENGFDINFYSKMDYDEVFKFLKGTIYLEKLQLESIDSMGIQSGLNIFEVLVRFDDDCEMENVRAFGIVHMLDNLGLDARAVPEDLIDEASLDTIKENGLILTIKTNKTGDYLIDTLSETLFLKDLQIRETTEDYLEELSHSQEKELLEEQEMTEQKTEEKIDLPKEDDSSKNVQNAKELSTQPAVKKTSGANHVISVSIGKLDQLLKLMGELVISEAMVTQNPELEGLELDSFHKVTRQLRKIINDIQDTVMSLRMVPLSTTFFKMHRIVRDMCKQLGKEIELEIVGEDTEVDKNITEHISDPIMHIIRNSADHGIEMPEDRVRKGKSPKGTILLEARNSGNEVLISVKDDGAGLSREKILEKARENGLLKKAEAEYTDKEVYQFLFMAGFSTTEKVTSFSGRGVGMDVVSKNLEVIGGVVVVDSVLGEGSTFTLKIPLTLAIVDGMMIRVGGKKYTLPIGSIRDSFKPNINDVFTDPHGNEMITLRGECYNIVRLYDFLNVESDITNFEDGIMILVENADEVIALFVDELVGEHQIVVKAMPKYIKKIKGISGCTLLGNGDISIIIDVAGLFDE